MKILSKVNFINSKTQLQDQYFELINKHDKVFVIIDSNIENIFSHPNAIIFSFDSLEENKNLENYAKLASKILQHKPSKFSSIIAIGGGVITDVSGFIASTIFRGIDYYIFPTSLIAQADSCIGGKNGVNSIYAKNEIGTIYPAKEVFIWPNYLQNLPDVVYRPSFSEIVKYALISNEISLKYLHDNIDKILNKHMPTLYELIKNSVSIKQKIIKNDLYDNKNKRILLNLGHSFGHALEQISNYQVSHGQAIALGLIIAAKFSEHLGLCKPGLAQKLTNLLANFVDLKYLHGLFKTFGAKQIFSIMTRDKKNKHDKICLVLINQRQKAFVYELTNNHILLEFLEEFFLTKL